MVYSTCSLNHFENEGVLAEIKEKYGDAIEIIFEKKFWPHIDKTGGFFMAKIIKKSKIESVESRSLTSNADIHLHSGSIKNFEIQKNISLYRHKNSLLAVKNSSLVKNLLDTIYCMRLGENIGTIEKNTYIPNARSFRDINTETIQKYTLKDEKMLDSYLR